jgi:hypothetical protein
MDSEIFGKGNCNARRHPGPSGFLEIFVPMQIGASDRAASVPDAWWRRRQQGTEWEQER